MRPFVSMCTLLLVFGAQAVFAQKPNVVLILVDDMGLHDLSVEGSTFYQSPNIDKLARGGMRFTQGYATCRVCSPSRASIQLGTSSQPDTASRNWIGARSGIGVETRGSAAARRLPCTNCRKRKRDAGRSDA